MTYDKELVMRIVQEMLGDNPQGLFISEDEYEYGEECGVLSNVEEFFRVDDSQVLDIGWVEVKKGASKVCLIPEKLDFVIKMPISGIYQIKGFHDPDFTYPDDPDYEVLKTSSTDILDEEVAMGAQMSDTLKQFVKVPVFVGKYCGIPVYVQEKISTTWLDEEVNGDSEKFIMSNIVKSKAKIIFDSTKTPSNEYGLLPLEFVERMVADYGDDAGNILTELNSFNIYDMNDNNFGFDLNYRACVIDYGGYDDPSYWAQESDWI